MSAPTIRILAFSPPAVNGQMCSVLIKGASANPIVEGSVALMQQLAASIIAATGPAPEEPKGRKPGSGRQLTAEQLALYRRVREAVVSGGLRWPDAARKFGAHSRWTNIRAWHYSQLRREKEENA